jgi:hypothetical protein
VEPPLCLDFPQPVAMQARVTPGNVYVLLTGRTRELAFFKIPRQVQSSNVVGARGLPLINLVASTVGVIHDIVARPGGNREVGCDVSTTPTLLSPAGVLDATLQEMERACPIAPLPPSLRMASRPIPPPLWSLRRHVGRRPLHLLPLVRRAHVCEGQGEPDVPHCSL